MLYGPGEGMAVTAAKPFKAPIKAVMHSPDEAMRCRAMIAVTMLVQLYLTPQEVSHERRDQRPRQQVGGHHRHDRRHRQRREQRLDGPGQKDHRDEDDTDGQRRDERMGGDLLRPVEDSPDDRLPLPEIAMNVFDFHRDVIHQIPTARANPPKVMTLSVWPVKLITAMEHRIGS
jgi:hypothetical protein